MFRVKKALNHNTVIAIGMEDNQEYLLLGKGIGFGKKVSEPKLQKVVRSILFRKRRSGETLWNLSKRLSLYFWRLHSRS